MKVNVDYKRTDEQVKQATNQYITRDYIEASLNQVYKDGLKGQLQRQVGRIQRLLDEAVENNLDEIKLDQADLDLVKDAVEKASFPTGLSKYVVCLQDALKE